MQFPDDGELFLAENKKHESLIFFVHFFKGNKKVLRRHIEYVNELGFDAYAFSLHDDIKDQYFLPYSPVSKKFGMKHVLADQIEKHFNAIDSLYKTKIIFAFSNVAASAIEMMARRFSQNKMDIIAMITDSGPGMQVLNSSYNLLKEQFKISSFPLRVATTPLFSLSWSKDLHRDVHTDLNKFPQQFPILSIRGWRDKLITPQMIDQVYEPHTQLRWQKLSLPEADHLNGLRDFESEYKPSVEKFLENLI